MSHPTCNIPVTIQHTVPTATGRVCECDFNWQSYFWAPPHPMEVPFSTPCRRSPGTQLSPWTTPPPRLFLWLTLLGFRDRAHSSTLPAANHVKGHDTHAVCPGPKPPWRD